MRTLAPAAIAVLGKASAMAMLMELHFSTTLYLAGCRDDLEWAGNTYLGGRQTSVESIKDQGGEVVGVSFSLSGVPTDLIALALAEEFQGNTAIVSLAIMEPETQVILDVVQLWTGTLDQMPIREEGDRATITVTSEHRGITFSRPRGVMYSDAEQQRRYPGDKCLEFQTAQANATVIWPASSFWKV